MLKPEQVPDEVVEAAIDAMSDCGSEVIGSRMARAAIAAALNAWPGMLTERRARCDAVVLPYNLDADLPQEASDAN